MKTFTIKFVPNALYQYGVREGNYLFGFTTAHYQKGVPQVTLMIRSVLDFPNELRANPSWPFADIGNNEVVIIAETAGNAIDDQKAKNIKCLYLNDGNYHKVGTVTLVKETF